ncbi:MAG: hypothetical protein AAF429_12165 [Pseudomonadota bacterium]
MSDFEKLDQEIRQAQADGDTDRLMEIYHALGLEELKRDEEAGAFLLVQALVYGLEAGRGEAEDIRKILKSLGREE